MTIKEFLIDNNLKIVQSAENLIINLITENGSVHAIDVDTSNIESGTILFNDENFILTDDTLNSNGITINLNNDMKISLIGLPSLS